MSYGIEHYLPPPPVRHTIAAPPRHQAEQAEPTDPALQQAEDLVDAAAQFADLPLRPSASEIAAAIRRTDVTPGQMREGGNFLRKLADELDDMRKHGLLRLVTTGEGETAVINEIADDDNYADHTKH